MASLNNIAENIAFVFGEQFNIPLKESIKQSIIEHRIKYIKQDLEKNDLFYDKYLQSFNIELEEANKVENSYFKNFEIILKSKNKVPSPIKRKFNGRSLFKFVGSLDRLTIFSFATTQELPYLFNLPLQDKTIYYTYQNGYIYILNNIKLKEINIEGVFEDPRDIEQCNNPSVFKDDLDFLIPSDMLVTIKNEIKKEYPQYIKDGHEINIDKDDRN